MSLHSIIIATLTFITFMDVLSVSFLNDDQRKIVFEISKKSTISSCLFFQTKINLYDISDIKQFSLSYKFAAFITEDDELTDYLEPEERSAVVQNTLMVVKDELSIIEKIFSNTTYYYYNKYNKWLLFAKTIIQNDQLDIDYDRDFMVVRTTNSTNYNFSKIYTYKQRFFSYDLGAWNRHEGMIKTPQGSFYLPIKDLNGTELVTYVDENCFDKNKYDPRKCGVFEVLQDISKLMNFKIVEKREKGDLLFRFSFLPSGGVDVLAAGYPWLENSLFTTVSDPIFKSTYNWYIKYPVGKLKPDYYLQPFAIDFWTAVIFSIIFGTISILLTQYFSKRFIGGKSVKNSTINNLFIGLETLCNQSGGEEEESISLRIISLSLRIIAIFSIASYGADITSYLTAQNPEIPFSNLRGFMNLGNYHIVTDAGSIIAFSTDKRNNFTSDEYKYLLENLSTTLFSPKNLDDYKPFLQEVCNEKTAIGFFDNDVYKLNPPCYLHKIEEPLATTDISLILKLNSPFQKAFNRILIRFYETGIRNRMQNEIYKAPKQEIIKDSFYSVKLEQMVQVLLIPFAGIGVSVGFFILEFIYANTKNKILVQNLSYGLQDVNLFSALLHWFHLVLRKIFRKLTRGRLKRCFAGNEN